MNTVLLKVLRIIPVILLLAVSSCGPQPDQSIEWAVKREYSKSGVSFSLSLSSLSINAAEKLYIRMESTTKGKELIIPRFQNKTGGFNVSNLRKLPLEISPEGDEVNTVIYTLEPFLPGEYTFPPMNIEIRDKNGTGIGDEIITDGFNIDVVSVIAEDSGDLEIRDIADPSPPSEPSLLLLLIPAALTIGNIIFYFLLRKFRRKDEFLTPYGKALKEIVELRKRGYLEKGRIKTYFLGLSDIMREYVTGRFSISCHKKTTSELTAIIRTNEEIDISERITLIELSGIFDSVKFAGIKPRREESERITETLLMFIEASKPVETEDKV